MIFTENIVVGKISVNVMNSGNVMPFIYWIKSFVVALFSVKPMNSVNLMSVKVMHDCTIFAVQKKQFTISMMVLLYENANSNRLCYWLDLLNVREGWEPLCEFLGVEKPEGPFPHVNDADTIKKNYNAIKAQSRFFILVLPALTLSIGGAILYSRMARNWRKWLSNTPT